MINCYDIIDESEVGWTIERDGISITLHKYDPNGELASYSKDQISDWFQIEWAPEWDYDQDPFTAKEVARLLTEAAKVTAL